jgi:hypothetical protein
MRINGRAKTRRVGMRNQFAQLADAPRFSPYQYAALWGTLRVGIERQAVFPRGRAYTYKPQIILSVALEVRQAAGR